MPTLAMAKKNRRDNADVLDRLNSIVHQFRLPMVYSSTSVKHVFEEAAKKAGLSEVAVVFSRPISLDGKLIAIDDTAIGFFGGIYLKKIRLDTSDVDYYFKDLSIVFTNGRADILVHVSSRRGLNFLALLADPLVKNSIEKSEIVPEEAREYIDAYFDVVSTLEEIPIYELVEAYDSKIINSDLGQYFYLSEIKGATIERYAVVYVNQFKSGARVMLLDSQFEEITEFTYVPYKVYSYELTRSVTKRLKYLRMLIERASDLLSSSSSKSFFSLYRRLVMADIFASQLVEE